jgi:hypothetical protein
LSTHPSLSRPVTSDDPLSTHESAELAQFLYRPIVFREPDRVVSPPSWLEHIPFAFWIVDVLRPAVFVELGTQSGNSYASFAQAIQLLGFPAAAYAVDTWRGDPQAGFYDEGVFTEWARYHDRHFSAFSRLIRSTFEEAVQHFADGSVDLLHIDGRHTHQAASADLDLWRPKLSRRGVILVHDINVRERDFGTWRLWEELKAESPSFEFLHGHGLGVVAAGPDLPRALQWLFSISSTCPADVSAVRRFFARTGGAISARFAVADVERLLRAERETNSWRQAAAGRVGEAGLDERERTISRLTDELALARERLATDPDTQAAQAAVRIADLDERLTRQRSEHEETLGHKIRLAAELQERLTGEVDRRTQLEEELKSEIARRSAPRGRRIRSALKHWTESILGSGGRRRVRQLKTFWRMLGPSGPRLLIRPARLREACVIAASRLFDDAYYRLRYPDVAASRLTPLAHFVLEGAFEGRDPHALFDTAYYLRRNPDVASVGINPLAHYRARGAFEGRKPHPLFDAAYYLDKNPDIRKARIEPLRHFLAFGAADGRNPNPFFDCSYYLNRYPDVARSHTNPLVHFARLGWREGRRPSSAFDPEYYLSRYADVRLLDENPLAHYLEHGRFEGREAVGDQDESGAGNPKDLSPLPPVKLKVKSLGPTRMERPTVLCLSHVVPYPPRAGNEYRIYRMLRWLRDQGYRVIPVIAPPPGEHVDTDALHPLVAEFSNAVLCDRDGRLEYVLRDVPDVVASLGGEFTRPVSTLLGEDAVQDRREQQLLYVDRAICHDALITTVLRLHQVLRPCILLAEYIWMSRILPLVSGDVLKVIDTIDVFSTKREKVLQFGINDQHVEGHEEARRLRSADLILAIQEEERQELQKLMPGKRVVTAGVDFDVVEDAGVPSGRRVLYVASDNPMNRRGLQDFLRFAWPRIRRDVPDAELLVAGRVSATLDVDSTGVIRLGLVDDLGPLYGQARVVINPAVAGTGLKVKTLEALGHLRPVVTWPSGTDGFAPELAAFCVTVQDWYEFSRRVAGLLVADEAAAFSPADRESILRLASPATVYGPMTQEFEAFLKRPFGSENAGSSIGV